MRYYMLTCRIKACNRPLPLPSSVDLVSDLIPMSKGDPYRKIRENYIFGFSIEMPNFQQLNLKCVKLYIHF